MLVAVVVVALLAGREVDSEAAEPLVRPDPVTGPFQGLGVWVDIYDHEVWDDPAAAAETIAAGGARTLYLQTSNADRPGPFVFRGRDGRAAGSRSRP